MGSESELLWGVLFGSVGFGFFLYGKKQRLIVPLICGLALMVYPYFMPNAIVLVLIGADYVVHATYSLLQIRGKIKLQSPDTITRY